MWADVRFAFRGLRRHRAFSATAVLTIALGIAVSTSVFSVVHGVLLAPLPYPEPDRLTIIWKRLSDAYPRAPLSPRELTALAEAASLHADMGGIWPVAGTLITAGEPEPLRIGRVTWNFLDVLGERPLVGRTFTRDDEAEGESSVVLSYGLWQRRFAGAEVIGHRVQIDGGWGFGGGTYTIVGVMPREFQMLFPGSASVPRSVDVWIPFQGGWAGGSGSFLRVVGRLRSGVPVEAGAEQVASVSGRAPFPLPLFALSFHDDLIGQSRKPLHLLQGAVLLMLLVVCTGVASLMAARSQGRSPELAIRASLGASSGRLARLLLTEAAVLAFAGGALGLALAAAGMRLLPLLGAAALPRSDISMLSTPVLGFALAASLATGLLSAVAPLLFVRRDHLGVALRGAGRTGSGGGRQRVGSALILVEIALSVVLLIGAGLLLRSLLHLQSFAPGFRTEQVLTFRLPFAADRHSDSDGIPRFALRIEESLRAIPGVQAAGAINQLPLDDEPNYAASFWTSATAADPDARPIADFRMITPGYFETLRAVLVAGRWFTAADDQNQQPLSVVVDDGLARKTWPGESAIGKELRLSGRDGPPARVVGVVRHLRHHRLSEEGSDQVFLPIAQWPRNQLSVVVRAADDPLKLLPAIRQRLAEIDPNVAPARVRLLEELAALSRAPARLSTTMAIVFAVLSLLVSAISLYGLVSYTVAQRIPELGVRAALGASAADLVAAVTLRVVLLVSTGLVLGSGGAFLAVRQFSGLLFGVTPSDPVTWVAVIAVVTSAAVLACYSPSRRAAQVDPIVALRMH